jgi:hypothetical protein
VNRYLAGGMPVQIYSSVGWSEECRGGLKYDAGVLPILVVYLAGVGVGLLRADASPGGRLVVALLWPLGLLAFALTIPLLLAAGLVLFPMVGAAVAVVAGGLYFFFG